MVNNILRSQLLKRVASGHEYNKAKASGFTLIEMLVVLVIVGVLAAIAGPSWLTFTNRQKLNSATNKVFTALKSAQSQAKKENRPKTVTINVANGTITSPNAQESLDSTVKITSIMRSNPQTSIVASNTATILFDEKGTPYRLDTTFTPNTRSKDNLIPIQIKLKHDLIGQEQCVTIRTLLGSVDTNCAL